MVQNGGSYLLIFSTSTSYHFYYFTSFIFRVYISSIYIQRFQLIWVLYAYHVKRINVVRCVNQQTAILSMHGTFTRIFNLTDLQQKLGFIKILFSNGFLFIPVQEQQFLRHLYCASDTHLEYLQSKTKITVNHMISTIDF